MPPRAAVEAVDERVRRPGSATRIINAGETSNCPRRHRLMQLTRFGPVRPTMVIVL